MGKISDAKDYIVEAKQELDKVTWAPREAAIKSTWVVIGLTIAISLFLGLVDFALSKLVNTFIR